MSFEKQYLDEQWPALRAKLMAELEAKGHVRDLIAMPREGLEEIYAQARAAYAVEDYIQAENIFLGMALYGSQDPRGWLGYGGACEAQQKWEQAALGYGMAMALTPGDPVAAYRAGVCLMQLGKPWAARDAFDAAASTLDAMQDSPKKLPYAQRAASMLRMLDENEKS